MRLLALDTSTDACTAALALDGDTLLRETSEPRAHASTLLPMVEEMLAEAGIAAGALDAVAFGAGPGSFTGVRIGAAVVQGLAFAADVPVVRLSSLAIVAARWPGAPAPDESPRRTRLVVAQDARMGEVYWAVYEAGGGGTSMTVCVEDRADAPEVALSSLASLADDRMPTALLGRAALAYPVLEATLGSAEPWLPRASDALALAAEHVARGEVLPPERALPVYFRPPV